MSIHSNKLYTSSCRIAFMQQKAQRVYDNTKPNLQFLLNENLENCVEQIFQILKAPEVGIVVNRLVLLVVWKTVFQVKRLLELFQLLVLPLIKLLYSRLHLQVSNSSNLIVPVALVFLHIYWTGLKSESENWKKKKEKEKKINNNNMCISVFAHTTNKRWI